MIPIWLGLIISTTVGLWTRLQCSSYWKSNLRYQTVTWL